MIYPAYTRNLDTSGYYGDQTDDVATMREWDGELAPEPTPIVSTDDKTFMPDLKPKPTGGGEG